MQAHSKNIGKKGETYRMKGFIVHQLLQTFLTLAHVICTQRLKSKVRSEGVRNQFAIGGQCIDKNIRNFVSQKRLDAFPRLI